MHERKRSWRKREQVLWRRNMDRKYSLEIFQLNTVGGVSVKTEFILQGSACLYPQTLIYENEKQISSVQLCVLSVNCSDL